MRVAGLPLHLWLGEFFKLIGNGYGTFLDIDLDALNFCELRWARILVRMKGKTLPNIVRSLGESGVMRSIFDGKS